MPVDLEDRLTKGLGDLARSAPVPRHWPELGAPVIRLDGSSPRRPRRVTAVVAAAAVIIVVATVFAVSRSSQPRGTTSLNAASEPGAAPSSTEIPSASGAPMGHWDPNGPRLSGDELASVLKPVPNKYGSVDFQLLGPDGDVLTWGQGVVEMYVVKTTVGALENAKGSAKHLVDILVYFTRLPRASSPSSASSIQDSTPVWVVVGRAVAGPDDCTTSQQCPAAQSDLGFVDFLIYGRRTANVPSLSHPASIPSQADLTALGPVGRWTPN